MKKLGWGILLLVLLGIFLGTVMKVGILDALIVWALALFITGLIVLGTSLIVNYE